MKPVFTSCAAIALVLGLAACNKPAEAPAASATAAAAGSIDGTWKADVASAKTENDDWKFALVGDKYTCDSCTPPFSSVADGKWHPVVREGSDEMKIEATDDKTLRIATRFKGKDLGNSAYVLSDDGQTLAQTFTNLEGEKPVEITATLRRTAAAPAGARPMSGAWTLAEYGKVSEEALIVTYKLEGDTLSSSANGNSWTAKLGGDPVEVKGATVPTTVKVEKTGEGAYRETYFVDGKAVTVNDVTIDGDTLSLVQTDQRSKGVFRVTAKRQ